MTTTRPRTLTVLRRYGLVAITGSSAGLSLHFGGLVGIDALFVEEPVLLDLDDRFWRSALSFPFLPILMEIALTTLTFVHCDRVRARRRRGGAQYWRAEDLAEGPVRCT
jgi:hypothetical protein